MTESLSPIGAEPATGLGRLNVTAAGGGAAFAQRRPETIAPSRAANKEVRR